MGYGENIRAARKSAGLTQEQLAKKCGFATITIGQYERNSREPRQEQLQIIADALNIHILELLGLPTNQKFKVEGTLRFSVNLMAKNISKKYGLPEETAKGIVEDCYRAFQKDGQQISKISTLAHTFDCLSSDVQKETLLKLQAMLQEEKPLEESSGEH